MGYFVTISTIAIILVASVYLQPIYGRGGMKFVIYIVALWIMVLGVLFPGYMKQISADLNNASSGAKVISDNFFRFLCLCGILILVGVALYIRHSILTYSY